MSTFRISSAAILVFVLIMSYSCETDIDIVAPKQDVTIVYGLLEANQTRHYIRINKSFVGEESATELANKPGVNEYSNEELKTALVREIDNSGNVTRNFDLVSTYVYGKEEGVFFNDSNKVYYFDAELNPELGYELFLEIDPEGEEGLKEVTAVTNILGATDGGDLRVNKPNLGGSGDFCEGRDNNEVDWVRNAEYRSSWSLKWSVAANASSYTSYAYFYYRDIYPNGTVLRDSVLLPLGIELANANDGEVEFVVSPESFYEAIGRAVPDYNLNSDDFERIVNDTLQFYIEVANEELATYVEINRPVTDIVQERPEYTNINNGIGLFASKYVTNTKKERISCSGRIMDGATLEELLYSNALESGEYTGKKNFKISRCNNGSCT